MFKRATCSWIHTLTMVSLALIVMEPAQAVVYDFKFVSGAQRNPAITGAGSYIFVEATENIATPDNDVLFKITSSIPQPVANLGAIEFDIGSHFDLFAGMSVYEQVGTSMAIQPNSMHPYLPGFTTDYKFSYTNSTIYDSRALQPGDSLTISGILGAGKSFANVVSALNEGINSNAIVAVSGLRVGVLAYNLLGIRPDPKVTLMDDAGFVTKGVVAVPELETWAMLLAGLGSLGLLARRRLALRCATTSHFA